MRERTDLARVLYDYHLAYQPSKLTVINLKTGQQAQEPSLLAVEYKTVEHTATNPYTGEMETGAWKVVKRYLAVGGEARTYAHTPDVMVVSPFRDGQVALCDEAVYLVKQLVRRVSPRFQILKPVLCIKVPAEVTDVEERAIVDLGIQAGARKVILYVEPLSVVLDGREKIEKLRNTILIDIQPQNG